MTKTTFATAYGSTFGTDRMESVWDRWVSGDRDCLLSDLRSLVSAGIMWQSDVEEIVADLTAHAR